MIADRYYFSRLSDQEKTVYKDVYQGIKSMNASVTTIPLGNAKSVMLKVWEAIVADNPHFFYFNQSAVPFQYNNKETVVQLDYPFSKAEISKYSQMIQQEALKVASYILSRAGDNEAKREQLLYEYFVSHYHYDEASLGTTDIVRICKAHSILGVFQNGTAVCEGFAKAFKFVMNAMDMKCIFVTGEADWMYKDQEHNHAWNIVKINKKNYHTDVTWGITTSEPPKYTNYAYLNLSDESIRIDHRGFNGVPKCLDDDLEFFKNVATTIDNTIYLKNFLKDTFRQRKNHIDILLVTGTGKCGITKSDLANPEALIKRAIDQAHRESRGVGFQIQIRFLPKRSTFSIDFIYK